MQYFIGLKAPDGSILYRIYSWSKKEKDKTVARMLRSFYTGENLTELGKTIRSEVKKGRSFSIVVIWEFAGRKKKEEFPIIVE